MSKPHKTTDAQPKRRITRLGMLMIATVAVIATWAIIKLGENAVTTIYRHAVAERVATFPKAWPVPPTTNVWPTATATTNSPTEVPDNPMAPQPTATTESSPVQTPIAPNLDGLSPLGAATVQMAHTLNICVQQQNEMRASLEQARAALDECSFALEEARGGSVASSSSAKDASDAARPPTQAPTTRSPFPYNNFPPGTW